jgi:hypothetical protein
MDLITFVLGTALKQAGLNQNQARIPEPEFVRFDLGHLHANRSQGISTNNVNLQSEEEIRANALAV